MWEPAVETEEARPPAVEQDQLHDIRPEVSTLMGESANEPGRAQPVAVERDQFGTPMRAAQRESVRSAAPEGEQEDEETQEERRGGDTSEPPQTATSDAAVAEGVESHEDGDPKTSSSNHDPAPASSPKPLTPARAERTVGSGGPMWSGQLVRGLSPLGSDLTTGPLLADMEWLLLTQAEDGTPQNVLILHTQPRLSSPQLTSPHRSSVNRHDDIGIIFEGPSVSGPLQFLHHQQKPLDIKAGIH
jgi:hypothetical protein